MSAFYMKTLKFIRRFFPYLHNVFFVQYSHVHGVAVNYRTNLCMRSCCEFQRIFRMKTFSLKYVECFSTIAKVSSFAVVSESEVQSDNDIPGL